MLKNGKEYKCNLCRAFGKIPESIFSPLDQTGVPIDAGQRPEISSAVYDFNVDPSYHSRECMGPHYVFIVDVSESAVETGVPEKTFQSVVSAVENGYLGGGKESKVAVLLLTDKLHLVVHNGETKNFQIVTLNTFQSFSTLPVHPDSMFMKSSEFNQKMIDTMMMFGSGIQDGVDSPKSQGFVLQALLVASW